MMETATEEQAVSQRMKTEVVSWAYADHKWTQRGTELVCPGDSRHFPHGLLIPPRYVLHRTHDDGSMEFKNVETGEITQQFPT